ncbi:hypothetical protein AB0L70_25000 [Kribbella sp. NPDC051952]|uniref:hypothetical protein n=1 Tax=Kribbella sp. NPDC051952 TaxID=3154851 RepID=UPI0034334796
MGELRVQLAESGADAERLDQLTGYLRQELLELDVDDVTALPAGEPPPGTRGIEALAIGSLLVTFAETTQGVRKVVSVIRSWLARGGDGVKRTIRLELDGDVLELSEVSATEQTRLIELFVTRHEGSTEE